MFKDYSLERLSRHKKVGIVGGTFDPVHYGHLAAAQSAYESLGLCRVLFIPTGTPPHKGRITASADERFHMVSLATEDVKYFKVSRIEIDNPRVSYTVDTVSKIREYMAKDAELFFIIGADTLPLVQTWKDFKKIGQMCVFVVVPRPNSAKISVPRDLEGRVIFVKTPPFDISSTDIKNRIKDNKFVKYMLPPEVEAYMGNIYKPCPRTLDELKKYVQGRLSERRFIHTLGVCDEAESLARHYGADIRKARIAAVLHDCAKDLPADEKIDACEKYGIKLDEILREQIDLTHSFIAEKIAEIELKIDDREILDAIACHTTGRAGMTLLDKIIYVADCIDKFREPYEGIDEIRKLAYVSLEKATIRGIKSTITINNEKNRKILPISLEALEDLEKQV
ncbi:hypothetical protein AGMMS49975_03860 [Clostridia bacterium]|nr:hypothetical protein AGMMS49975_03860 [Clostridia bacterium]